MARTIAATYPPPVRRRWGSALTDEIARRGVVGWFDSLAGAARLWLRPGQWPASSASHARRAVVVLALLTAAAAAVGARGIPSLEFTARSPGDVIPPALVAAGLVTLVPVPRRTRASLLNVARALAVPLAPPCVLFAAVVVVAHRGVPTRGVWHAMAIAVYWTTIVALAFAPAAAALRLDPDHAVMPGRRRATAGLVVLGAGFALIGLVAMSRPPGPATVYGTAQFGLAALTGACVLDLRRNQVLQPGDPTHPA